MSDSTSYDDENYRLFDPEGQIWPSNDYSNLIISRTENGTPNNRCVLTHSDAYAIQDR